MINLSCMKLVENLYETLLEWPRLDVLNCKNSRNTRIETYIFYQIQTDNCTLVKQISM